MKIALFLDTMVYLHYQRFDQIDWYDALGLDRHADVTIVVPAVTLREIDKKKNENPRLRDRAQRVTARLLELLKGGPPVVRAGVRIEGYLKPLTLDFSAAELDRSDNDDVLFASMLDFGSRSPEHELLLISHDGYPQLRADGLGLSSRVLSEDLRLPLEEDPVARENQQLKRELNELKVRVPKLRLTFLDGKASTLFHSPVLEPLSDAELAAAMRDVESKVPPAETFRPPPPAPGAEKPRPAKKAEEPKKVLDLAELAMTTAEMGRRWDAISEREFTRYAEARAEFLEQYAEYLTRQRESEQYRARQVTICWQLVNDGSAPALDIDVSIRLPKRFVPDVLKSLYKAPKAPKPPEPPRTTKQIAAAGLLARPPHLFPPDFNPLSAPRVEPNATQFISRSNPREMRAHVKSVKHGMAEPLPILSLVRDPRVAPRSFQIPYVLNIANAPKPVLGKLNFVLQE